MDINFLNVADAFRRPNAIRVYCRKASGVTKAEILEAPVNNLSADLTS